MNLGPLLPQNPVAFIFSIVLFIALVVAVVALLRFVVSKR